MKIDNNRIAHMHGVAEWMYTNAEFFGCKDKNRAYLIGLLHDVGFVDGVKDHELNGAKIVGSNTYIGKIIKNHGITPVEYIDKYKSNPPKELILLWAADLCIDAYGNDVGFDGRLEDIKLRHGEVSSAYRCSLITINWLKNYLNGINE